jgi:hypothetical protein
MYTMFFFSREIEWRIQVHVNYFKPPNNIFLKKKKKELTKFQYSGPKLKMS